jgi:hypothetical protein
VGGTIYNNTHWSILRSWVLIPRDLRNLLPSFMFILSKVKVKVYAGSHQRALRKGSQLVLALARAPPKTRKKRNNRD